MTFEHRIVVSLDEIKALIFECTECGPKAVVDPEHLERIPKACPKGHGWDWDSAANVRSAVDSQHMAFVRSLQALRNPLSHRVGFKGSCLSYRSHARKGK